VIIYLACLQEHVKQRIFLLPSTVNQRERYQYSQKTYVCVIFKIEMFGWRGVATTKQQERVELFFLRSLGKGTARYSSGPRACGGFAVSAEHKYSKKKTKLFFALSREKMMPILSRTTLARNWKNKVFLHFRSYARSTGEAEETSCQRGPLKTMKFFKSLLFLCGTRGCTWDALSPWHTQHHHV